jgi:hypothetical protein
MAEIQTYDARFKHPSTVLLCGSSKSGKTTFVHKCLRNANDMFVSPPSYTLFYYAAWQDVYDQMRNENLVQEWKNECPQKDYIEELGEKHKHSGGLLVIIDDMLSQMNKDMADLFQVVSHHSKTSIWFLSQNLFHDDKHYRDMKLNVNYIVLFKNPNNTKQAMRFFNQIAPETSKALLKVFQKVTKQPYSYLVFDLHQETPDDIRIRTNIFPNDQSVGVRGSVTVYAPPI